jgi:hypothetical protein
MNIRIMKIKSRRKKLEKPENDLAKALPKRNSTAPLPAPKVQPIAWTAATGFLPFRRVIE